MTTGDTKHHSWFLATPTCSGEFDLKEGFETTLECQSVYSGSQPTLEWLRGSEEIDSEEDFEIRLAKRSLSLTATYKDDKQSYTCRMTIGNVVEECHVILSVKRKCISFTPVLLSVHKMTITIIEEKVSSYLYERTQPESSSVACIMFIFSPKLLFLL